MNQLDHAIETVLEELVERNKFNLRLSEETLAEFRRRRHHHSHPHFSAVGIGFTKSTKEQQMATATSPGPVTLTTPGQQAVARLFYFDQDGKPMPSNFTPPAAAFSTDDSTGAVAKIVDNGDNTASVTDVADGTATLSVKLANSLGVEIEASQTVTVSNGGAPPPPPPPDRVLTSVGIGFDQ